MDSPQPIWHATASPGVYLRCLLTLDDDCADAQLRCASSGPFQLSVDGDLVGAAPPRLTERPVWWDFSLPSLRSGEHEIIVYAVSADILSGDLVSGTKSTSAPWFAAVGGRGGLSSVSTDASWQALPVADAGIRASGIGERHAAMEDPRHAASPLADGDRWQPAVVVDVDAAAVDWSPLPVVESELAPVRLAARGEVSSSGAISFTTDPEPSAASKCVHAETLLSSDGGRVFIGTSDGSRAAYLIFDFGHPTMARARLRLRTEGEGGVIDMGFASAAGVIESRARYVCGVGRQSWTAMQVQACRYLALRFSHFDVPVELEAAQLVTRATDSGDGRSTRFGAFEVPDVLSEVWEVGYDSVSAARQEVFVSTGDEHAYDWFRALPLALNDFYLNGDSAAARTMLTTARIEAVSEGELPRLLAYPLFVQQYLMHSGDTNGAREALQSVGEILEATATVTADGLLPSPSPQGLPATALNALAAGALAAGAELSRLLEAGTRAQRWLAQSQRLGEALQSCWSEHDRLFADNADVQSADVVSADVVSGNVVLGAGSSSPNACGQLTNGLMLLFGLVSEVRRDSIIEAFGRGLRARDLSEAFYATWGLCEARAQTQAAECMDSHWVRLLGRDGVTWSHKAGEDAAAPGVDFLLGSYVLGVRALTAGFASLELRPPPGDGANGAEGTLATPAGPVSAMWRRHADHTTLEIERVSDGDSHLAMPRGARRFPTVILNGETVWRNEKMYPNTTVRDIVIEASRIVLIVRGAGRFTAVVE